jgi:hypothetical protein
MTARTRRNTMTIVQWLGVGVVLAGLAILAVGIRTAVRDDVRGSGGVVVMTYTVPAGSTIKGVVVEGGGGAGGTGPGKIIIEETK